MKLVWATSAWEDYLYWQKVDKKIVKRINELIKSCVRTPYEGIGKPEALIPNRYKINKYKMFLFHLFCFIK